MGILSKKQPAQKKGEREMLSALLGGAIIRAYPDPHPRPWIDFRGNTWSDAEVQEMKRLKIAEVVPTINITPAGIEKAKEMNK